LVQHVVADFSPRSSSEQNAAKARDYVLAQKVGRQKRAQPLPTPSLWLIFHPMRALILVLALAAPAAAQDLGVAVRPETVYVENAGGNIGPMERMFFHIVIEN